MKSFDQLVSEAWEHEFSGWDFAYLEGRMKEYQPSWNYREIVRAKLGQVSSLLDIGTGGGEFLSTLQPFPESTYAIEAYPPNVWLAGRRLKPLGAQVIWVNPPEPLPFASNSIELAIDRHAGVDAIEVYRILIPGGRYITQQVGGKNNLRLNELLQDKVEFIYSYEGLDYCLKSLTHNGFQITRQVEEFPLTEFYDIGAVVYFLKAISWQIEGFNPHDYKDRLLAIHRLIQKDGKLVTHCHRYFVEAVKPLQR